MNVGERIRELRKRYGLTASELGELLGVSQAQVSRYEKGQNEIPLSTLERFCTILGITLPEFFAEGAFVTPIPPHLRPLIDAARDLNREQVEALANMIVKLRAK
ncbi:MULTISPECIES: helix-turn-helix domain-containing protein [Desulfofundulus]|uniref:XRE family transcriptional regulator n=1 Tax=Desulfofundulus salinus TaxID=2419843 RepID=A0A494WSR3_9FIRM|nr:MULTISPECIES: helix-turn-helix transcriptional regulator [Desulfofundulus]NHM28886.1 helix-turn-helix transcriptional regulator [Desulfofundulus sp. TPOSR]RKO66356.1 XRE family transcriptional regulator [Desulfofundulus salinum]